VVISGYHRLVVNEETSDQLANAAEQADAEDTDDGEPLLFPVGHYLGARHRVQEPTNVAQQVRRGATFHDLTNQQLTIWTLAHGSPEAVHNEVAWRRRSVEELAKITGLIGAADLVQELIGMGLLVEVVPGTDQALDFAKTHRVVPLMLGLGNTADEPWLFGIGFISQPILQVTHPIYDLWQWSAMDDTLWATCENAADVASRAKSTDPEYTDPDKLLTGFLGSLHALLFANAAYLDDDFRLSRPQAE